jgi:hypothetical protein
MDVSNSEEAAPLIPKYGIPKAVRDGRKPYEKKLAIFFILASTLFERIAFFSLESNIKLFFPSSVTQFHWNPRTNPMALSYIFSGK